MRNEYAQVENEYTQIINEYAQIINGHAKTCEKAHDHLGAQLHDVFPHSEDRAAHFVSTAHLLVTVDPNISLFYFIKPWIFYF